MGHDLSTEAAAAATDQDLREVVARLSTRVAALEAALAAAGPAPAAQAVHAAQAPEEIPEALLPVLIAAAAAYLGVRPVLRQVRLIDSAAWAQAGRARLQASHALPQTTRTGA